MSGARDEIGIKEEVGGDSDEGVKLEMFGSVRVSEGGTQALQREFKKMALSSGGRYDGWAAEGMTRQVKR